MRTKQQTGNARGPRPIVFVLALGLALMPALAASARDVTDEGVTSAINTELWVDDVVSANSIDVATAEGVVTLEGTVNNLLAKERAQALAEAIVGVRAIINQVEVQPVIPRADEDLASAVEDAWLADPVTYAYKLQAEADDGVLTISGTVHSYAEQDLAATVAKGVRGVTAIENEIAVDYQAVRSDPEIEREIEARLENNVLVDDYLINVEVLNGVVTLSGTVGSLQEKTQARHDALVAGVRSVNADELAIEWWAREEMKRTSAYVSRTDEEIKQAVEDAFLYDPRVQSFEPTVAVTGGTATLSGTVDNLKAKRAAEQDARNTLGVWRVRNHLKVRPTIPADEVLEERVAAALLGDPYVNRYDVTVAAHSGWVYLSGAVNNSFEKNRAERVTEGVQGVAGVVNRLDYDYLWTWKPDWEIRADVSDQLWWSVFVDESDINVSVDNGVVTLSGTVDSWSERNEAEKNAYQGGAKDVVNNLVVDYRYYGPYGPGYYGAMF